VIGITTITAPKSRLYKKFANEGVIEVQPILIFFIIILMVCFPLEKPNLAPIQGKSFSQRLRKHAGIVSQLRLRGFVAL
jgi:hypothetical protein